jgi:hypothetical protein
MSYIFITLLINCTGGQDEKVLDLIIPQYNALNSPSTLVDMSKQSGRDLSIPGVKRVDKVDVFVAQDALGSEDRLLSMQIAVEKDKAVERGLALSSNQRKAPAFNMNHQSGRAGVVPGSGALELDENGHVINEKHVLDLDVKDQKTGNIYIIPLILVLNNFLIFKKSTFMS